MRSRESHMYTSIYLEQRIFSPIYHLWLLLVIHCIQSLWEITRSIFYLINECAIVPWTYSFRSLHCDYTTIQTICSFWILKMLSTLHFISLALNMDRHHICSYSCLFKIWFDVIETNGSNTTRILLIALLKRKNVIKEYPNEFSVQCSLLSKRMETKPH